MWLNWDNTSADSWCSAAMFTLSELTHVTRVVLPNTLLVFALSELNHITRDIRPWRANECPSCHIGFPTSFRAVLVHIQDACLLATIPAGVQQHLMGPDQPLEPVKVSPDIFGSPIESQWGSRKYQG